jgi:hypothetical protein
MIKRRTRRRWGGPAEPRRRAGRNPRASSGAARRASAKTAARARTHRRIFLSVFCDFAVFAFCRFCENPSEPAWVGDRRVALAKWPAPTVVASPKWNFVLGPSSVRLPRRASRSKGRPRPGDRSRGRTGMHPIYGEVRGFPSSYYWLCIGGDPRFVPSRAVRPLRGPTETLTCRCRTESEIGKGSGFVLGVAPSKFRHRGGQTDGVSRSIDPPTCRVDPVVSNRQEPNSNYSRPSSPRPKRLCQSTHTAER